MADLERAREEYNALEWVPDGEMGFDPGGREVKAAADALIAALEAENEALKCCGNCTHHEIDHDPYGECTEECDDPYTYKDDVEYAAEWPAGFGNVRASDPCHFTPSRWEERT